MRAMQFWILLIGSTLISLLMIKQIFLARSLHQEQGLLSDAQDTFALGPRYENAWKQLALHIYKSSSSDPALAQVLKDQKIEIHATPVETLDEPAGSASANAPASPGTAAESSKNESNLSHP